MALTLEEMERDAVQSGDNERAEILRLAIEKQDQDGALEEAEMERERADEAEMALSDLLSAIAVKCDDLQFALEAGDISEALVVLAKIREEL